MCGIKGYTGNDETEKNWSEQVIDGLAGIGGINEETTIMIEDKLVTLGEKLGLNSYQMA